MSPAAAGAVVAWGGAQRESIAHIGGEGLGQTMVLTTPAPEWLVDAKREEKFAGTECGANDLASYWRPGRIGDHCR
jgi:hypothetical protein